MLHVVGYKNENNRIFKGEKLYGIKRNDMKIESGHKERERERE
jgi:hypothetical protein